MELSRNLKYFNDLDEEGYFDTLDENRRNFLKRHPKYTPDTVRQFVQGQDDSRQTFSFTYKAARFEEGWLTDSLGYFYEQKWISDVLSKIRTGKESSVYLCRAGEQVAVPLIAAKVYRPRMLRNLRDDHVYREGRMDLDEDGHILHDEGSIHAIVTRSSYGEQIRHQSWIAHEFSAMQALYEAGADIPKPYEMAHNAILMDYVGDSTTPAPTLREVALDREEAGHLFMCLMKNIKILLAHEYIHGDLSAYNILYWEGGIFLIDFPQVISPRQNRNAHAIFERDLARVCEYFNDQGLSLEPVKLASDIWRSYGYFQRMD